MSPPEGDAEHNYDGFGRKHGKGGFGNERAEFGPTGDVTEKGVIYVLDAGEGREGSEGREGGERGEGTEINI